MDAGPRGLDGIADESAPDSFLFAPRPSATDRVRANIGTRPSFTWQAGLIVALLCIWENVPLSFIGFQQEIGYEVYGAIVFAGALYYFIQLLRSKVSFTVWEAASLLTFAWCVLVSYNYSTNIRPIALAGWLLSIYTVAPLLTILLLKAVKATRFDAEQAIYWTGLVASVLVVVDLLAGTGILQGFARASAFDSDNRIVFLKLPTTFALIIGVVRTFQASSARSIGLNLAALAVMGYNLYVISESRLAIVATLIALVPIWFFVLSGYRKYLAAAIAPFLVVPFGMFLISKYLPNFQNLEDYLASDTSAKFRRWELEHFRREFETTDGWGFGFMSGNQKFDNILSFAHYKAGYLVGTGKYGMGLVDIGLASALYQFGYVGFVLILGMTLACIAMLASACRFGRDFASTSAIGFLMGALMMSPISMNYFTLFYTGNMGAVLWFIASQVGPESRRSAALRRPAALSARAAR